jgi:hypothetical protein
VNVCRPIPGFTQVCSKATFRILSLNKKIIIGLGRDSSHYCLGTVHKGTKGFLHCSFKSGAFHVLKGISQNIVLQISFFLVLTPRTCFGFNDFHIFHVHKK